jgi:hypothetical protein
MRLCLRRNKPFFDLAGVLTAIIVGWIAWTSDKAFHHQAEILEEMKKIATNSDGALRRHADILDEMKKMVAQDKAYRAREAFNQGLDEAESYCPNCTGEGCPPPAPPYLSLIALNKAVSREPDTAILLSQGEYNRLAILGSAVWDYHTTEVYAKKALDRSKTPIDKFFSCLVLGHINFMYFESDPAHAFSLAVA